MPHLLALPELARAPRRVPPPPREPPGRRCLVIARLRLGTTPALGEDAKHVRLQLSLAPISELLSVHNVSPDRANEVTARVLYELFRWGRP